MEVIGLGLLLAVSLGFFGLFYYGVRAIWRREMGVALRLLLLLALLALALGGMWVLFIVVYYMGGGH
jgi:hypothetical protein